ncbi:MULTISPECIES: hypothetical protein [Paracoccus]|uniref:hypothetical protein n=1 Tax=Paracoccus TaxID=265 RepID=UPI0004B0A4ED|nr:hypothetical protein [Paracoccus sp. J39]
MSMAEMFTVVIAANMVTIVFLYAVWRIKKNENDWPAIGLALFCCLIAGVASYATLLPT